MKKINIILLILLLLIITYLSNQNYDNFSQNEITNDNILISVTSIPRRISTSLIKAIQSIQNQSIQCKIIINIPIVYKKWNDLFDIPIELLNNNNIIINRTDKDYGPATKLFGAIEYLSKNKNDNIKYIITIDDDIEYNDYQLIENMINNINKYPNYVIANHSINLTNYEENISNLELKYNNTKCVDVPGGFSGVVYPIFLFDKTQFYMKDDFIKTLPSGIYNDDDAYFGIIMNLMNI